MRVRACARTCVCASVRAGLLLRQLCSLSSLFHSLSFHPLSLSRASVQVYFYTNFLAYILGLVTTVVFMVWFKAAQVPAMYKCIGGRDIYECV
jgi:hypothetical protein